VALILLASMISVELGVTAAIVEIALGVVAGNVLGIDPPGWLEFLATFASVVLTFGTISSLYALNAGIIDQTQFSVLVTVVLTAILPTIVAQSWFTPIEPAKDQPSWKGQIG
jgi:ABC-type dipeptide/oligopeptide/nickel transport system permease component